MIKELNERSQLILKHIIDSYMQTGTPVGSRTLSELAGLNLSSASIRNIMADLETAGLLHAPHTSAGRLPTQQGLRLYIDGLMEIGDLSHDERHQIELQCRAGGRSPEQLYETASTIISGLSSAAGLVIAPKTDKPVKQIEFVRLDQGRLLVVLVMQDGTIENRVMDIENHIPTSSLTMAANYLNERLAGKTLLDAQREISQDIERRQTKLDHITTDLVQRGIALIPENSADNTPKGHLVIRGQSKLLNDVKALEDLEQAQQLLAALEEQQTISRLLDATQHAQGIEIFIGTENRVFNHSGWSMIISPYKTQDNQIIGAIGVIGPTRLNYSRIIPIVDYTSKVIEKLVGT